MIFDSQEFSRFEKCPRLPIIERTFEPPRWPIREAVKHFLESGVRGIMAGESPEMTIQAFLGAAASPGFNYPQGEPYIVAKDHAAWLDGALRIILEESGQLERLPIYEVGSHQINIEGWSDGERVHIFRAAANFENPEARTIRWPDLCTLALTGLECTVHVFRLPSVRNGRILSPLTMAYQHPAIGNIRYRLARLYDEDEFNKNWKKMGRWEIQPEPLWDEWRQGIEADRCIDQIREIYTVSPTLDDYQKKRLLYDIELMCESMEKPNIYPRFRETCQNCVFAGLCHGDERSRAEYQVANPDELKRFEDRMKERV